MMTNELIRQALRLLGMVLVASGWLPQPIADAMEHPETVAVVAGIVSYAIAEVAWLASKART
jgi:hypothetical protein